MHAILIAAVLSLTPIIPEQSPPGRIYDGAHLLNPTALSDVANEVTELEKTGTQAAVVTLADSDGHGAREVAHFVQNTWNLPPTSVVMVVTLKPKFVWLQPGDAFSDSLSASDSERIAREEIAPRFRQAAFGSGIVAGLKEVNGLIHHSSPLPDPIVAGAVPAASAPVIERAPEESGSGHLGLWILFGLFAIAGGYVVITKIIAYRRRRMFETFPEGEAVDTVPTFNRPVDDTKPLRYTAQKPLDPYVPPAPSPSVNNTNLMLIDNGLFFEERSSAPALPTPVPSTPSAQPSTLSEAHARAKRADTPAPSYSSPSYSPSRSSDSDSGGGSSWGGFSSDSGGGSSWGSDSGGGSDFGGGGGDSGGGSGW